MALLVEKQSFRTHLLEAVRDVPVRVILDQGGFGAWEPVREKIERLHPDVLLVDLGEQPAQRFAHIQAIRTLGSRPPSVVVIHDSGDAQVILSAMRAGAAEFLTVPLEPGALKAALERVSELLPVIPGSRGSGGSVLAFLASKGGAGATTLAVNVAAALGSLGNREVLLADLDLETGNVGFALRTASPYSILDACRSISRLDGHYWKGLVTNGLKGLSVLSAPTEPHREDMPEPVEVSQVLRFARTLHDFSVVDLASRLSHWTLSVVGDADRVFLVTTADLPSLHQVKRALQKFAQAGYPADRLGLVVNRASRHDEVSAEDIERNLGVPIFWRFPNDVPGVTEFYLKGGVLSAKSELGKSIRQFVAKIAGPPPPAPKSKEGSMLGL